MVDFPYKIGDRFKIRASSQQPAGASAFVYSWLLTAGDVEVEYTKLSDDNVGIFNLDGGTRYMAENLEIMKQYIVKDFGTTYGCLKHMPVNVGFSTIRLACKVCDTDLPEDYRG